MPRLLPRLLASLSLPPSPSPSHRKPKPKPKRPSLWRPSPPPTPSSRTTSILLDDNNVITSKRLYRPHKRLPPRVRLERGQGNEGKGGGGGDVDVPREMTEEEKRWWANPYLRMLSSPIRQCTLTQRKLPSDFLIRLSAVRLPTRDRASAIVPDGLEHPKFKARRVGWGYHLLCWRDAVPVFVDQGKHKRITPTPLPHPHLPSQISHLLRARILQELQLLTERAQARPQSSLHAPLIRRLTRAEWRAFREGGVGSWEGAVAVLVVPPVNRDSITKKREQPVFSEMPPNGEDIQKTPRRPIRDVSTLHHTTEDPFPEDMELSSFIPNSQIPLYNGAALFPSRPERALLHSRLTQLLHVERRARYRKHGQQQQKQEQEQDGEGGGEEGKDAKASHAFLLRSDGETVGRADTVPLAIALWRLRMFEGLGWEEAYAHGWMWNRHVRYTASNDNKPV